MAKQDVIVAEESSYKALLLRKNRAMKWAETGVFVIALYALSRILDWQSGIFKIGAILIATAVIGFAPFLYRVLLRPRYVLTPQHLTISIKGKEERIPLPQVKQTGGLRYTYLINGKKMNLMVSDSFLERLEEELDKYKR